MNKTQIIKELFEAYENLDSVKMDSYYAKNTILTDPTWGVVEGKRRQYWLQYSLENISNHKIEIQNIKETNGELFIEWNSIFIAIINDKKIVLDYSAKYTFEGDKIATVTLYYSVKELYRQLFGSMFVASMAIIPMVKIAKIQNHKMLDNYIENNSLKEICLECALE